MFSKAFVLFLAGSICFAQNTDIESDYETVVQGVIFNSSSKVVIDEKTIKESNAPDLISLITTQANITLFNNNFQPPQLFLRGAESSHILIMIDNVLWDGAVIDPTDKQPSTESIRRLNKKLHQKKSL